MTRIILITVTAITFVWLPNCSAAAVEESNDGGGIPPQTPTAETAPAVRKPRQKIDVVTMADFYLRDGNTVSGKLLSDDSTQIVIEQLLDSTVITKTYSKREIDNRTLKTRIMPESQYYSRLGEYFSARTWDFIDDPDDFIQAIRCYERAKQSLEASGADAERIAEIDKIIKKIKDDREVWTAQVESRAKLKKLEYDAEAENRLKQLEKQVAESSVKLTESMKYLDKYAADMKADRDKTEQAVAQLNKDFVQQINNLQAQIRDLQIAVDNLWFRLQGVARPSSGGGK
ncbi:MAG: hypothetical protein ABSG82_04920 [Sedimentisphaerales bacterium]|jgi:hypothetical protein